MQQGFSAYQQPSGKEVKVMEVSASMALSAQSSPAINCATYADEAGNPQTSQPLSAQFSRLLERRTAVSEDAKGPAEPSANYILQKVIDASKQQQQPISQLIQQQEKEIGFLQAEQKQGIMQSTKQGVKGEAETTDQSKQDEESEDHSSGRGVQALAVDPALSDFSWAQPVAAVNPFMVANADKQFTELLATQSSFNDENANSSLVGKTPSGFAAEGQLAELSAQNGQQLFIQTANAWGEKPGAATQKQSATLPLQDGSKAASTEAEPSAMQSEAAGKTVQGVEPSSTADRATSATSLFIQEAGSSLNSSSVERSLYRQITQGGAAKSDGVAEPMAEGLKQAAKITLPQTEGISLQGVQGQKANSPAVGSQESGNAVQEPATAAETPVSGETRMGGKEAANAYMASAGETSSQVRSDIYSTAAGTQSAEQATKPKSTVKLQEQGSTEPLPMAKLKSANSLLKSEQNGMDLATKPGLNSADSGQAQQVEIAFAGDEKSLLKETTGEVPGMGTEGKSAGIETTSLFVQVTGETRLHGESKLSAAMNDGKLPSAEQINHQVREKLESGDYGSNKGNITLKLHPEELGELKINLRMEEQHLKIEIVTEHTSVKEALMQNLATLKETLSRQNIAMDRFNVSTDIRQGLQQGARDERQLRQGERGTNASFQPSVIGDESTLPKFLYGWENDNSLVSLVL
jgi:flagellar hook-length control protein FliK